MYQCKYAGNIKKNVIFFIKNNLRQHVFVVYFLDSGSDAGKRFKVH